MGQMHSCSMVIFIGIAGPSGCGKSTYAKHLADHLQSPFSPIQLDHFFRRSSDHRSSDSGSYQSYEQSDTLNIQAFSVLLHQLKQNPKMITRYHREDVSINNNKIIFIIVEGFLLFALSDEITNLLDVKIFLDATLSECRLRRYRRRNRIQDAIPNESVIVSEQFQQWFDHLVWNEYLKQRDLQMQRAEEIFHSNDYLNKEYALLDDYIGQRIEKIIEHKRPIMPEIASISSEHLLNVDDTRRKYSYFVFDNLNEFFSSNSIQNKSSFMFVFDR